MTDTGAMTERLTLQKGTRTEDLGGGEGPAVWADVAKVWGKVKPLRGQELVLAGQMQAPFSHRINIHWRSDVTTEHRLLWNGRALNIRSVQDPNPGHKRELEIMAMEGEIS